MRMVPLRGHGGEITGVIGVATDATERVRAEARLLQTDRLVAVGTLAAGVTPEIEQPLGRVVKYLDFVSRLLRGAPRSGGAPRLVSGSSIADALRELSTALHVRARRLRGGAQDRAGPRHVRAERARAPVLCSTCGRSSGGLVNLVSTEIRRRARLVRDLRDVPLVASTRRAWARCS